MISLHHKIASIHVPSYQQQKYLDWAAQLDDEIYDLEQVPAEKRNYAKIRALKRKMYDLLFLAGEEVPELGKPLQVGEGNNPALPMRWQDVFNFINKIKIDEMWEGLEGALEKALLEHSIKRKFTVHQQELDNMIEELKVSDDKADQRLAWFLNEVRSGRANPDKTASLKVAFRVWNVEWISGGSEYNEPEMMGTTEEIGMWQVQTPKNFHLFFHEPHPYSNEATFVGHMWSALLHQLRTYSDWQQLIEEGDQIQINHPTRSPLRFLVEMSPDLSGRMTPDVKKLATIHLNKQASKVWQIDPHITPQGNIDWIMSAGEGLPYMMGWTYHDIAPSKQIDSVEQQLNHFLYKVVSLPSYPDIEEGDLFHLNHPTQGTVRFEVYAIPPGHNAWDNEMRVRRLKG